MLNKDIDKHYYFLDEKKKNGNFQKLMMQKTIFILGLQLKDVKHLQKFKEMIKNLL